ncbi:NAD(P)H-dependent oxidoreductase, partial [candidate division KSB1 bacterium]|nr:NAD(P)H-dependent oxidoreductase [candidate division KSB1 bacterium]
DGAASAFTTYLEQLGDALKAKRHQVSHFKLCALNIKYCVGCWGCWLKTPGECSVKDDSALVCREMINSDFVLFASPVTLGFTNALMKKTLDKTIPLLHPYIEIDHGECHHRPRYTKYPALGLLLEKAADTDPEDLEIITQAMRRYALNFKSNLRFTKFSTDSLPEVCDAIDPI